MRRVFNMRPRLPRRRAGGRGGRGRRDRACTARATTPYRVGEIVPRRRRRAGLAERWRLPGRRAGLGHRLEPAGAARRSCTRHVVEDRRASPRAAADAPALAARRARRHPERGASTLAALRRTARAARRRDGRAGSAERGDALVVCAGFMWLLTPGFLARFPGRVINVHPVAAARASRADAPSRTPRGRRRARPASRCIVVDDGRRHRARSLAQAARTRQVR